MGKRINGHTVIIVLASKGRRSIQPVTAWQNDTEYYLKKYGHKKTQTIDTSRSPVGEESGYKQSAPKLNIPPPPGKVKLQSGPDTPAGLSFQQGLDPGAGRVAQMKATLQGEVETAAPEPPSPLETRLRQARGADQEEPFTSESGGGIIEIGRSLGAKAVNYDVMDLATGEVYHFVEGSKIQDVQVFAGKGSRVVFRRADFFATRYGGKLEDWQHAKGFGLLETPDGDRQAEVHWVQCAGLGKFEFFLKEWLD